MMKFGITGTVAADLALVVCAFFWGLGVVAMKNALSVYPTYWLLSIRFSGGALLMGMCFAGRIVRASRRDLFGGAVIGVFLFMGMGLHTLGLNHTTVGKQAFLTASYVVMVPLVLWALRGVFPGAGILGASFVCFAGMGLLTSDISGPLNIGDILAVIAALCFAGQIICIGRYAADGDPFVLAFVQFCVTAILAISAALFFHDPFVFRGREALIEVAFATFICTFFCFTVQNFAQKVTPPAHASILLGLESVFALMGGIFILSEPFTPRMAVGCSLILGAILIVELLPTFLPSRITV